MEPILDTRQHLGARLQNPHEVSRRTSDETRNARTQPRPGRYISSQMRRAHEHNSQDAVPDVSDV